MVDQTHDGSWDVKAYPTLKGIAVTLLTGGGDKPYAFGLASELISKGARLDIIGSDELDCPEFQGKPGVNFLNLRGDQRPDSGYLTKVVRLSKYYAKLIRYAATAEPGIFHILWNNKLEWFDRTFLMLYYKALGKKIALTVHNVNARKRDARDTAFNRVTLRIQYRLCDHIFVHTEPMKRALTDEFGVQDDHVSIIPFGINNAVPNTGLSEHESRQRLGIENGKKTILFFGNIAPYKGLEFLVAAYRQVLSQHDDYCLIVAGRPKNCEPYWASLRAELLDLVGKGRALLRADFIPDDETEVYFKAADILVLPYRYIYQSGVLFLSYSFGLPVLVADVGSLKDEVLEGKTGFVFKPEDPADLARAIETYFASNLYAGLEAQRQKIKSFAAEGHSWNVVGLAVMNTYAGMLGMPRPRILPNTEGAKTSIDAKAS